MPQKNRPVRGAAAARATGMSGRLACCFKIAGGDALGASGHLPGSLGDCFELLARQEQQAEEERQEAARRAEPRRRVPGGRGDRVARAPNTSATVDARSQTEKSYSRTEL